MGKPKVKTKKKNKVTIDELNAYNTAYGDELGKKEFFTYVILPGFLFCFFATILLYQWVFSLIMFLGGVLYGWMFFLPKSIKKNYEKVSFQQRNNFINNMTQVMTDPNKTVSMGLNEVAKRAEGEFQDDLLRLQASLFGSNHSDIKEAFYEISSKYEDDVVFTQYMEQIETAALEGTGNAETLKDVKVYHNQMKEKQQNYEKLKQGHLGDMKVMAFTITVFILALTFSFGFDTYISAFARSLPGYITVGVYLTVIAIFFKQFSTYLFDDSVTTMRSK